MKADRTQHVESQHEASRSLKKARGGSSAGEAMSEVGETPVVCLGPGGSYVRSLCADESQAGSLVEGSISASQAVHQGACDLCGAAVTAGASGPLDPVGVVAAVSDAASRASTAAADMCRAALARVVGILATADGIFERQQMSVFRLAHGAASAAAAFRDVAQPSPVLAGFGPAGDLGAGDEENQSGAKSRPVSRIRSTGRAGEQTQDGGRSARGRVVDKPGSYAGRDVTHGDESDSEATPHSAAHSRLASAQGLFADDAGTGGRDWREQSDRLRARRSAHQKERPGARAQQGTLFVDR